MSQFMEQLEARFLMSAAPASAPSFSSSFGEIVVINWKGMDIRVVKGEYLVGLEGPEPVWINGYKARPSGDTTPAAAAKIQEKLDAMNLGIQFSSFLGVSYMFKIKVQGDATPAEVLAAVKTLDGFAYMDPNSYGGAPIDIDVSIRDTVIPEPVKDETDVIDPVVPEPVENETSIVTETDELIGEVEPIDAIPVLVYHPAADDLVAQEFERLGLAFAVIHEAGESNLLSDVQNLLA